MANKIALVDDDQNILTSVSLALEAEGFSVDKYLDGEQGVNGINRRPPDLLVLDIKMPRLDGMEVLERMRKTSNLPVIFFIFSLIIFESGIFNLNNIDFKF